MQERDMVEKERELQFDEMMTEMMRTVISRPLLVELASDGNFEQDR